MKWYPWLNKIYIQIIERYKVNKGHHFLLIQSCRKNGEDSLIYALSRWLMCFSPVGVKSCNECYGCRLMKSNCHPDYYSLIPEEGTQSIGVEKIRLLISKLYQYAYISTLKIVYIKSSEWLTEESVNALLKIFEEPPQGVYFFLGCRDSTRLLPTFLSRCVCWTLSLPEEKMSLLWLYKNKITDNIQALTALRLSGGSPLEAYSLLKSEYWGLRLGLYKGLRKSIDSNDFLNLLSFFRYSEDINRMFVLWVCGFLIDILKWRLCLCNDYLVNIDQMDLIYSVSSKLSLLVLSNQLQQWLICLRYWESIAFINQKLLLAYQLLNIEKSVANFS